MAIFKTELAAKQDSQWVKDRAFGNFAGAEIQRLSTVYTFTGSEAAGDVIDIGDVPVGAIVIPQLSSVVSEGAGTATLTKIGDAENDARYSATAIALTAGTVNVTAAVPTADTILPYRVTDETKRLKATLSAAGTAGKRIVFFIAFTALGN